LRAASPSARRRPFASGAVRGALAKRGGARTAWSKDTEGNILAIVPSL